MRKVRRALAGLIIVAISATAASAEMPKALKGTWILDAQATEKYIKAQPDWDAEHAGILKEQLYQMREMMFEFTDDAFVASRLGLKEKERVSVTLKESNSKKFVFEAKMSGKAGALTVTFVTDTAITVEQSGDDSMRYYLWKRGSLPEKKAPSAKAPPQK